MLVSEPVIIPVIRGADLGGEALAPRYLQGKIKAEIVAGLLSSCLISKAWQRYYLIQLWPGKESRAPGEFSKGSFSRRWQLLSTAEKIKIQQGRCPGEPAGWGFWEQTPGNSGVL